MPLPLTQRNLIPAELSGPKIPAGRQEVLHKEFGLTFGCESFTPSTTGAEETGEADRSYQA